MSNKRYFLILLFFLSIFPIIKSDHKQCGEEQIENCKNCDINGDSNSCELCENSHFPLLENLLCLSCDDPIYGQIGCKGECDASDYSHSGFAYCSECKDGFYNLEGICHNCSIGSDFCSNCTYEPEVEGGSKIFKCTKCLNDEEYILNEHHYCTSCNSLLRNCKKCHFINPSISQPICDECYSGYYLDSNGNCQECGYTYITGGRYYSCGKIYYYCDSGYIHVENSCLKCPSNCDYCKYNSETKKAECSMCETGYVLTSKRDQCIYCGSGCQTCILNENNAPICTKCDSNTFLGDNHCLTCPSECRYDCEYNATIEKYFCNSCSSSNYIFIPENRTCISCSSIEEIGGNACHSCYYYSLTNKFRCLTCNDYNYYSKSYVYVQNTYQCFSNKDSSKVGLYGCLTAEYNETLDKYSCLSCYIQDKYFIPVINEQSCIPPSRENLYNCLKAEKIDEKYSCVQCSPNYALVDEIENGIKKCYNRNNKLVLCSEGILENGEFICTKCINNAIFNTSLNVCECDSISFLENNLCYKCSDEFNGNPGCEENLGCDYNPANDQLDCKQCKKGYFNYTEGQCFSCSDKIPNCNSCHYNETNLKLICDECINNIYTINKEENNCELNECEEYPDISPGCIICKNNLDEYKKNKKCDRCKYGYFKTKDEKCVLCSSDKTGGTACEQCGYELNNDGEESDNIVCKECFPHNFYYQEFYDQYNIIDDYNNININDKCYNCRMETSKGCYQCEPVKENGKTVNVKCIMCKIGYYLTPEGNCLNFTNLIEKDLNCLTYSFSIGDLDFTVYTRENDHNGDFNINLRRKNGSYVGENEYNNIIKKFYPNGITDTFKSKCSYCKYGYLLTEEGNCLKLDYDICSFNSISKMFNELRKPCNNFCYMDGNVLIKIRINEYENKYYDYSINSLDLPTYHNLIQTYGENITYKSCLNNSGLENDEFSPKNLKKCQEAYYIPENDTYICDRCINNYNLDNVTNLCIKNTTKFDPSCINNNGTDILPSYYCVKRELIGKFYNTTYTYYTLVTYENGQKEYIKMEGDLEGCVEANADSTYINSKYNCTKCSLGYIPYYNKFFGRIICQNMKAKIIRSHNFSQEMFDQAEDKANVTEEKTCDKNYLFTPDQKFCYKCNDKFVGNPGCKGNCSFSLNRNRMLKCESGCKEGYIEASEGVCSPCNVISKGCHECHYDLDYPTNYTGIKRQRKFVCDYCEDGFMQSSDGKYLDCEGLGIYNCSKCEKDPNDEKNYICTQCFNNFFVNENGECESWNDTHFKGINRNKLINCGNNLEGGISHCLYCGVEDENVKCKQCNEGFILLNNNNTCLEIIKNKDLYNFQFCDVLTLEKNKFQCIKCKKEYVLIKNKNDNTKKCKYIKTLYDQYFELNYQSHFSLANGESHIYEKYNAFIDNDYIYQKYNKFYYCQEGENLGTEDNPLYTCTKCYENLGKSNQEKYGIKITEENSNISYCIQFNSYKEVEYCLKANTKIKNGKQIFNCTECFEGYALSINKLTNTYYCQSMNATSKCVVLYCKTCNPHDGYKCDECLPDYSIDSLTGSCVKKTEVIPAVTWKDIYRLNMNSEKMINNKYIYGPSMRMVGIASSQINTRHAFLIYLTFKIKSSLRYLENENNDNITMPAICEILEAVDATEDDVNMVEYECIGNNSNKEDMAKYQLDDIQEGNNENSLKKSNLNDIVSDLKENGELKNLETKLESDFTIEDLMKIYIFKMNEKINNFTADNFKFNFKIEGKLNKKIPTQTEKIIINEKFNLSEIDNKADCKFELDIDQTGVLNCELNVENHKNIKTFSFKTSQIIDENKNEIYLSKFNDITLINNEQKEDKEDKDNKTKIIIIVVCVVGGTIIIGAIVFFFIYRHLKAKKNLDINNGIRQNSNKNENISDIKVQMNNEDKSGNRINTYNKKDI